MIENFRMVLGSAAMFLTTSSHIPIWAAFFALIAFAARLQWPESGRAMRFGLIRRTCQRSWMLPSTPTSWSWRPCSREVSASFRYVATAGRR